MPNGYYTDQSYPPIGTNLQYRRGDGALVTLSIAAASDTPQPHTIAAPPTLEPDAGLAKPEPGVRATKMPTSVIDKDIYDNPVIGGKYTVFVLFYGGAEYHQMHMRCLNSIISTCPPQRIDLRVGSNALCQETADVINRLVDCGVVRKHYAHEKNDYKYPVMRQMFYDSENPITTNYLLWFDDDSIADRNQQWLLHLTNTIVKHPAAGIFGADMVFRLSPAQQAYYRSRPWFKNKPFRLKTQHPAPNGEYTKFVAGGFFALKTEAMRAADIPDVTLAHNGGDYTIGEQLYQTGFDVVGWNRQKQFIHTSSVARRGESQPHFGTHDWQKKFGGRT